MQTVKFHGLPQSLTRTFTISDKGSIRFPDVCQGHCISKAVIRIDSEGFCTIDISLYDLDDPTKKIQLDTHVLQPYTTGYIVIDNVFNTVVDIDGTCKVDIRFFKID